ncbi:MAG: hypothetical protein ACYTFQ_04415 [Planctomycetota bacterium]|jgi:hypothetical protein
MTHSHTTETSAEGLRKALEEKLFWHGVMLLWAHTEKALGSKEKRRQVNSFGFDHSWLTPEDKVPVMPTAKTHHNFVRLQNNHVIPIPPFPRPVMPEWMQVDLQVKV